MKYFSNYSTRNFGFFALAAFGVLAVSASNANAEIYTVSFGGSSATTVVSPAGTPPSTIALNTGNAVGVTAPDTVGLGLHFVSGYDPLAAVRPFTVSENVTITDSMGNTETQLVTLVGQEDVSPTTDPDTVEIFAGSGVAFSSLNVLLTTEALTFLDNPPFPGGTLDAHVTADITATPEPGTWAMMLTGLGAVLYFRRSRFANQS